jgi:hypothetical protein
LRIQKKLKMAQETDADDANAVVHLATPTLQAAITWASTLTDTHPAARKTRRPAPE